MSQLICLYLFTRHAGAQILLSNLSLSCLHLMLNFFVFVKRYHLLMWPNDFKSKNLLGFHGTLIFGTLDGPQLPTKILICSIV